MQTSHDALYINPRVIDILIENGVSVDFKSRDKSDCKYKFAVREFGDNEPERNTILHEALCQFKQKSVVDKIDTYCTPNQDVDGIYQGMVPIGMQSNQPIIQPLQIYYDNQNVNNMKMFIIRKWEYQQLTQSCSRNGYHFILLLFLRTCKV